MKSNTNNPWLPQEKKIRETSFESRKIGPGRKAAYPEMKKQLYEEFKILREKGVKVKEWWSRIKCKSFVEEMHPGADFKMSDYRFSRFKTNHSISLGRPTNTAQRPSDTLKTSIQQFHRYNRQTATNKQRDLLGIETGGVGPWDLNEIANMDQTPLEFCFNTKGASYSTTGKKNIWARSTGSGHDKRQCTIQLTVFVDGEPRVKPLLILKGIDQRISEKEPGNTTRESSLTF